MTLLRCTRCEAPLVGRRPRCVSCVGGDVTVTLALVSIVALLFFVLTMHACEAHAVAPPVPLAELDAHAMLVMGQMVQIEGHADVDAAAVLWTLAHRRDRLQPSLGWTLERTAIAYSRVLRQDVPEGLSRRQRAILAQRQSPADIARLVELWAEGLVVDPCVRPALHWGAPGRRAPRDAHGVPMVRLDCGETDNWFFGEAP